jgi:hypothetical protein
LETVTDLFEGPTLIDGDALASMFEVEGPGHVALPERYVPGGTSRLDDNEKQRIFLADERRELLYGGAAGGGKSDALLMAALQYVEQPNYNAILFRRTYADLSLPGALMPRAAEWLSQTSARWNETKKQWTFPSGATLTFGYLQHTNDKFRYQSAEFDFIGFDELTQFPEADYLYLFSRLRRRTGSKIPPRMRAASNPGGTGHRWVHERFIAPYEAGSMPDDRGFIPAKLDDNPHVDREQYELSLAQLDEVTRAQLRQGDWNARLPGPWVFDHHGLDAAFNLGDQIDLLRGKGKLAPPLGGSLVLGIDFGETSHVLIGWPLEAMPRDRIAISRAGCPELQRQIYELQFKDEDTEDVQKQDDHGPDALIALAAPLSRSKGGHGLYVPIEYVYRRGEPDTQAHEFYDRVLSRYLRQGRRLGRQRFDASKPESMRLWVRGLYEVLPESKRFIGAKPSKIAFNKYKRQSILHLRYMMEQTLDRERRALAADERREAAPQAA